MSANQTVSAGLLLACAVLPPSVVNAYAQQPQHAPHHPDPLSHVVQLLIDSVTPQQIAFKDSFVVWYTVLNNSNSSTTGVVRSTSSRVGLMAGGDSLVKALVKGLSFAGHLKGVADAPPGTYKVLVEYLGDPKMRVAPAGPGGLKQVPIFATKARDSIDIAIHSLFGVFTNNNNNERTGAYRDTILRRSTITPNGFGKIHTWSVDGQIYTQPLYVHRLPMANGRRRNVVYVATQRNHAYAFDADDFEQIWDVPLGPPVPWDASGCSKKNIYPWVGVTSTPAIDPDDQTIYIVSHNIESGRYFH